MPGLQLQDGFEQLIDATVRREDIEEEVERLRSAVGRHPELQPLLDAYPDEAEDEEIGLLMILLPFALPMVTRNLVTGGGGYRLLRAAAAQRIRRVTKPLKALQARQLLYIENAAAINNDYWRGRITLEQWEARLRLEQKGLHISAAVAGKGFGWDDMTFSDWGAVGNRLRNQYGFLAGTARKIIAGSRSEAQVMDDLRKYAASARASFERTAVVRTGFPFGLLPTVPGAGDTDCYTNCKCWWQIRCLNAERGDFDVSWRLSKAEHCRTCRKRADREAVGGWAGKKVRRFRLTQPFSFVFREAP